MSNDRLKFRAWHKKAEIMVLWGDSDEGDIFPFYPHASDCQLGEAIADPIIDVMQWTGLYDISGAEIYQGDIVYIAGYGDYTCDFPFTELYEALTEGDIGAIKGNIYDA